MAREHEAWADIVRIAACVMVVAMHAPMPCDAALHHGPMLTAISYFSSPCIGLFFMLSGAFVLPAAGDYSAFMRRRLGRIAVPAILWTFIYMAMQRLTGASGGGGGGWLRGILSIPFSPQGSGVLWFMYTLTGLYLLAPILSAWLEKASRADLLTVMWLWGVSLCYPFIGVFLHIDTSVSGILYYFSGYAGYFLLGYCLRRYSPRRLTAAAWIVGAAGAALIFMFEQTDTPYDFYSMFWYLSVFSAAMCVAWWQTIRRCALKIKRLPVWATRLSGMTFGIYLCHILVMRYAVWHIPAVRNIESYPLQTVAVAVLSFGLSWLLCALLSSLPRGYWLTGYGRRRRPVAKG